MMKMKMKRYGYIRVAYVLILSIVLGMCFGREGSVVTAGVQTGDAAVMEVSEEKEIAEVDLSISTGQDSGGGETVTVERVVVESGNVETCEVEIGVVEGTVNNEEQRKIELSVSERFREGYSFKKDGLTVIVKIGGEECSYGTIDILEEGKKVRINSVEISSTSSPSPKPEVTRTPEPPTVTPNPPGNVTATPNPPTDKPTADPSISPTNSPAPAPDKTEKPTVEPTNIPSHKPTESPVASVIPTEPAGPDPSEGPTSAPIVTEHPVQSINPPTVSPDTSFPPVESADPGSSEGPTAAPTDAPSENPTESPSSSPVITDTGSVETVKPDTPVPHPSISPITPPAYTITFNANGGVVSERSITYTAEQLGTIKLPEPTRKDYLFIGWYDGKTRVEKITAVKNLSLKAQWVKKTISGYYPKLDLKKLLKLSSDVKLDEGSIKIEKKFRKKVKINQKKKLVTVKKYFKKAKLSLKINGKKITVTVNVKLPQPVIKVTRAKKAIAYTTGVYRKFNFKYVYQKGATRAVAEYYSQKKGKYVKCSSIQNRLKGAYANVRKGTSVFFRVTIYYGKYKSPQSATKELKG